MKKEKINKLKKKKETITEAMEHIDVEVSVHCDPAGWYRHRNGSKTLKKIKLNKLIVENVNKFIFGQFIKVVFSHWGLMNINY